MKPEVQELWVAALRSGEYEQTTEYLHEGNGFCCLGVLCDISGIGSWVNTFRENTFSYNIPGNFFKENGVLPFKVAEWAGLDEQNPFVMFRDEKTSLGECNDMHGRTFEEIADLIESGFI